MSEKERFEKFAKSKGLVICPGLDGHEYSSMMAEFAWIGWQAAIQSNESLRKELAELIVKLRKRGDIQRDQLHSSADQDVDECADAIQSILDK